MSERRPHWDDELIMAVGDAIENADSAFYPTFGMVASVIAAVEDWARWEHVPKGTLARIERVRELHYFVVDEIETREGTEDVQYCSECGYIPTDEEPCPTIRTLDGTENE